MPDTTKTKSMRKKNILCCVIPALILFLAGSSLVEFPRPAAAEKSCGCACGHKCPCGAVTQVPHFQPRQAPAETGFTQVFVFKGLVFGKEKLTYSPGYRQDIFRPPNSAWYSSCAQLF